MPDTADTTPSRLTVTAAMGLALTALGIAVPVSGSAIRMAWDAGRVLESVQREATLLRRDLDAAQVVTREARETLRKAMDDRDRSIEARLTETERAITQGAIQQAATQAELRGINNRLDEIKVLLGGNRR